MIMRGDNSDHSGDRLNQSGEKQQVKTAWKMSFRNYYVAYAFVLCM